MKRFLAVALFVILTGAAVAATGINVIPALITNTTGAALTNRQLPFPLSSQALVDGTWMSATGLNTDVQQSGSSVPYMPGTGRTRMLACFNNAGVDETTACNNATAGDVTLPSTGSQVYEFAADNQFNTQWVNVSTAGAGVWTVTWEYYNGVSYVALSSVSDGTTHFRTAGLHRISWAFPTAGLWPSASLHSITGYWVRARISSFTSQTIAQSGQQAYYETGRWWTFASTMGIGEQRRFDVQLDTGSTNQPYFSYFPHSGGITVTDSATLETGVSNLILEVAGLIDTTAGAGKNIVFKQDAVELTVSTTSSGTLIVRISQ